MTDHSGGKRRGAGMAIRLERLGWPGSPKSVYSAHEPSLENYLLYSTHGGAGDRRLNSIFLWRHRTNLPP